MSLYKDKYEYSFFKVKKLLEHENLLINYGGSDFEDCIESEDKLTYCDALFEGNALIYSVKHPELYDITQMILDTTINRNPKVDINLYDGYKMTALMWVR